jgi:hypothetical protein
MFGNFLNKRKVNAISHFYVQSRIRVYHITKEVNYFLFKFFSLSPQFEIGNAFSNDHIKGRLGARKAPQ